MMLERTTEEIYWIAGLLEGEGCFQLNPPTSVTISLEMTDKDTVTKAMLILDPITVVNEHAPRKESKLSTFKIQISGEMAIEWMKRLCPLMSKRRQTKINELLEVAKLRKLLPLHKNREANRNELRIKVDKILRQND